MCSSHREETRLFSASSCFIAVEVSICLFCLSEVSTWSNVPWLNFILNRGKLPRKVSRPERWLTESCTSLPMVRAFSKGRASLENDTRPGRPDAARSNENVEKTHAIVKQDRRIATRLLTERFGVGKNAARQTLETDLKKIKIYSKFVSHSLRQYRGSIGLNVVDVSSSLLTKIVKCHKELWLVMRAGVFSSILERILISRK